MGDTPERELSLRFHIDTNRINARGGLEHVNRLEAWAQRELIEIHLAEPAYAEAIAGGNRGRAEKAMGYIQASTSMTNSEERAMMNQIEAILFPDGAQDENERNDVEIIFNAHKYGARLVTADGSSRRQPRGMLGAAEALRKLDIHVMSDADACALVEEHIRRRDRLAREWAKMTGGPLPSWVDHDC